MPHQLELSDALVARLSRVAASWAADCDWVDVALAALESLCEAEAAGEVESTAAVREAVGARASRAPVATPRLPVDPVVVPVAAPDPLFAPRAA